VRTRWFDDVLLGAAAGVDQVALLGAGLDTRAFRLPLPERLRLYEVDQAAAVEEKERTLAGLGARPRCSRAVVAADLAGAAVGRRRAARRRRVRHRCPRAAGDGAPPGLAGAGGPAPAVRDGRPGGPPGGLRLPIARQAAASSPHRTHLVTATA